MERAREGRLGEVLVSLADLLVADDVIDLLYALPEQPALFDRPPGSS
jgi:hypothetical protein